MAFTTVVVGIGDTRQLELEDEGGVFTLYIDSDRVHAVVHMNTEQFRDLVRLVKAAESSAFDPEAQP